MASRPPGYNFASRRNSQPVYGIGAPSPGDRSRRISEAPVPPAGLGSSSQPASQAGVAPSSDEKSSRKSRGAKDLTEGAPFDPDYYNPDGSIRTVHKMPDFSASYAEASKARYIRHRASIDSERELRTDEIFGKKS